MDPTIDIINHKQKTSLFFLISIIVLTVVLYYPLLKGLIYSWKCNFANTLGYLAPFVSVWAIYFKRKDICYVDISTSKLGWYFFSLGLILAMLSRYNGQPLFGCVSLTLYLYGISLVFFGRKGSRYLLFPIFFLLFLYPWGDLLNFLIGFNLRRFSVYVAYLLFKMIDAEATISGTLLYTGKFLVDVAPSCSGLTIMNVLLFMAAIGAFLYNGKTSKGLIIFFSAIPLSILLNAVRILITGLTGHFYGEETAMSFYHYVSGMVVFGLALLFLYWEGCIFKRMDNGI
jgi:exosortase